MGMTVHTLLAKISHKLRREIGCSFHFVDAAAKDEQPGLNAEHLEVAQGRTSSERIYSGKDILFPIFIERIFKGVIVLSGGTAVNNRDLDQVERFVRDSVCKNLCGLKSEPDFEPWFRYRDGETDEANVIYLSQVRRKKEMIQGQTGVPTGGALFVHATDPDAVQKVAVDMFRELGSSGLVPWYALDSELFKDTQSIRDLGRVTIFVADISQVSAQHQSLMESYLSEEPMENTPQFILGARKPLESLLTENAVNRDLLLHLKTPRSQISI
jgi:hypothetical protein